MRRILFVAPSLEYSGTARQLTLLVSGLPRDRCELCVAVLGGFGPLAESLAAAGVRVESLDRQRLFDLAPLLRLRRLVKGFQPDILHAWGLPALRAIRIATGLNSKGVACPPIVATRCLPRQPRKTPIGQLMRWLLRSADRVVATGQAEARQYQQCGVSTDTIVQVPPGVPEPTAHHALPTARSLVCVGPIERHKGFRDAIWAFDILRFLYDDLQLLMVGDGPDRPRLQEFTRAIQATDHVHFLGPRANLSELVSQATVVWVPSVTDGGRQVALEAMAAGRTVVASRLPALGEVIIDGQTGFLVPPGDKVVRAKQTRRLLDNPELARQFGEAGRRHVLQYFSVQDMVCRYVDLYDDLLRDRRANACRDSA